MKKAILFARTLIKSYIDTGINGMSLQLSYYMLFSFFPLVLFVSTVISRFFPKYLTDFPAIPDFVPRGIYDFAAAFFAEATSYSQKGLSFTSLILFCYLLTRYIRCFKGAIGKIYGITARRGFISEWLYSLFLSVALFILFFGSVLAFFVTDGIIEAFFKGVQARIIMLVLRFLILGLYAFFVLLLIHKVELKEYFAFKKAVPGCGISIIGWVIISTVFSYYSGKIANYSILYGSVGNVIMLLVWLNLTNTSLLLSAFINVFIQNSLDLYRKKMYNVVDK